MKNLFLFFLVICASCGQEVQTDLSQKNIQEDSIITEEKAIGFIPENFIINYPEYQIVIDTMFGFLTDNPEYDHTNELTESNTEIEIELGFDLQNNGIRFIPKNENEIVKVEMSFLTSLSLSFEGPHYDLTDWKHFDSGFKTLKQIEKNYFRTLSLTNEEMNKFPEVSDEELQQYIHSQFSETEISEEISGIKSMNDSHCSVGISHYFLKVISKNKEGKINERILEFHVPMGC